MIGTVAVTDSGWYEFLSWRALLLDAVRPAALLGARVLAVLLQAEGTPPRDRRLRLLREVEFTPGLAGVGVFR
jgi:hypothetical protein